MKHVLSVCTEYSVLQTVAADFKSMKKIVEDANRPECKYLLPDG